MRVNVKLFAVLREKAGTAETSLELPDGTTVASAVEALASEFPQLRDHLQSVAFAVNRSYVKSRTSLGDGDELALIPPVSGG